MLLLALLLIVQIHQLVGRQTVVVDNDRADGDNLLPTRDRSPRSWQPRNEKKPFFCLASPLSSFFSILAFDLLSAWTAVYCSTVTEGELDI
nr:hypothetical protein Iba_chr09aCG3790 [Ipomoea batatas]